MPVTTLHENSGPVSIRLTQIPVTDPYKGTTVRVTAQFSCDAQYVDQDVHVKVTTASGDELDSEAFRVGHDQTGHYVVKFLADTEGVWRVLVWTDGDEAVAELREVIVRG